jgi:hypothetical protein
MYLQMLLCYLITNIFFIHSNAFEEQSLILQLYTYKALCKVVKFYTKQCYIQVLSRTVTSNSEDIPGP